VTSPPIPTKSELIAELRSSGTTFVSRMQALPASEFEQGRYENGWNGRQILAHVASIEWTYPRLLDIARQGAAAVVPALTETVRRTEPGETAGVPTRTAQGGIDAYNARQVERRADASVAELIEEFERNRAALIAAVEQADDALFAAPIRSAGGITGPLAGVIQAVAVGHILGHMRDITVEA
jgi:hypothetical protein